MKRELLRTSAFIRAAKRHLKRHPQYRQALADALDLLASDAFDPRLKTHKLSGNLAGIWACSAGRDLRILFELVARQNDEAILLLTVGTHDEVY